MRVLSHTHIKAPLQPVYVIHGEEDLLRIEAIDTLRYIARKEGYLNREVLTVENSRFDWLQLAYSASSLGLFADHKLLEVHILNGKPGKVGSDALCEFAQNLPENTVSMIVLPKLDKIQLQSKWFKALVAQGVEIEAKAINVEILPKWIRQRLNHYHLTIDDDALSLFVERVQGNLLAASQEADKLALLLGQETHIDLAYVQNNVANVARFDIFQLSEAYLCGQHTRLLPLLEHLQAVGESPLSLLWIVSEDIRMLLRLNAGLKNGESLYELRRNLRLWGNKQDWAMNAIKRVKVRTLLNALQTCATIDRICKGAQEGNEWDTFKDLVWSLAQGR